jgi:hypothetical protein
MFQSHPIPVVGRTPLNAAANLATIDQAATAPVSRPRLYATGARRLL